LACAERLQKQMSAMNAEGGLHCRLVATALNVATDGQRKLAHHRFDRMTAW